MRKVPKAGESPATFKRAKSICSSLPTRSAASVPCLNLFAAGNDVGICEPIAMFVHKNPVPTTIVPSSGAGSTAGDFPSCGGIAAFPFVSLYLVKLIHSGG